MRNKDWSMLDIGKSWKWGMDLFESNYMYIILSHDTKHIN